MRYSLLRIFIVFVSGIGFSSLVNTPIGYWYYLALVLFVILNFCSFRKEGASVTLYAVVFLGAVKLSGHDKYQNEEKDYRFDLKKAAYISGVVEKKKVSGSGNINLVVAADHIYKKDSCIKGYAKVLLHLRGGAVLPALGSKILFKAKPEEISSASNPEMFDFKQYWAWQSVHWQQFMSDSDSLYILKNDHSIWDNLRGLSENVHNYCNRSLRKALKNDDRSFALANALILGNKEHLTYEQKDNFTQVGAAHLLAVSGLHVGIIYLLLAFFLSFLSRLKYGTLLSVVIMILALWGYAVITGLSASVVRAVCMFSLFSLSKLLGRKTNTYQILILSAFIMLLSNVNLIFDVGFQLSYAAVIGILYFFSKISTYFNFKFSLFQKIWELFCVSLSANITTLPLVVYYFNQFPISGLLYNIVLTPFAFIIVLVGPLQIAVSGIPFLGVIVGKVLHFNLEALSLVVEFLNTISFSLKNLYINKYELVYVYVVLFLSLQFLLKRKLIFLTIIMVLGFGWSINRMQWEINNRTSHSLRIYHIRGYSASYLQYGNRGIAYLDSAIMQNNKQLQFNMGKDLLHIGKDIPSMIKVNLDDNTDSKSQSLCSFKYKNIQIISCKGKVMAFFDEELNSWYLKVIRPEILVLRKGKHISQAALDYMRENTCTLIVDSSCKNYHIESFIPLLRENDISFHIISENGAFIKYF